MERPFSCDFCYFATARRSNLIQHLTRNHRGLFSILCQENNCERSFSTWHAYVNHRQRVHRVQRHPDPNLIPIQGVGALDNDLEEIVHAIDDHDIELAAYEPDLGEHAHGLPEQVDNALDNIILPPQNISDPITHAAVKFLVDIQEGKRLTHETILSIKDRTSTFVHDLKIRLQDQLQIEFQDQPECLQKIKSVVESILGNSPFQEVNSKHMVQKYLHDNCGMIKPVKIIVGKKRIWKYHRVRRPRIIITEVTCYIIPFKDSLQQLLNNKEILKYISNNPVPNNEDLITDFYDGDILKQKIVDSGKPNVIHLFLYLDDIQIANPLGSKQKKNKVCMIYYSLGNIPPHLRSSLKAINLLGVIRSVDLKTYGLTKVLNEFITCINQLESEEGLEIIVSGLPVKFHGTLLFVCADTPAANSVGGFKESVSKAHRPCRCCMITHNEIQTKHSVNQVVLRTKQMHMQHCLEVESLGMSKRERAYWSRLYGVTCSSVLSKIEKFDVTKQLTMDFMHVVLEGTALLELKCFLNHCINNHYFTLEQLNICITQFQYPSIYLKDKPSTIEQQHLEDGHCLRQYAVQMLCLLRFLPFMIHDLVPHDDPHLENFLLLAKITNYCLAFAINRSEIPILSTMITLHNIRFSHLYPDVAMTPKFHFMHHLPQNIQQFGLLRHQWCLRFEASHQWYKEIARSSKCYKNLPYTMCKRQQMLRCMEMNYGDPYSNFLSSKEYVINNGQLHQLSSLEHGNQIAQLLQCTTNEHIFSVKKITCMGIEYTINRIVLLKCVEDELPVFGNILQIYVHNNTVILSVRKFETQNYDPALNAYAISPTRYCLHNITTTLPASHIMPRLTLNGKDYVVLVNHTRVEFFG